MNADTQVLPPSMTTEAEMSDLLVARAQRGDSEAFVELIDVYDRRLRTLAYDLLGDGQLVDDVIQDAYLHAFRGLKHFRRASSLGTWLYRITYNACHDALRHQRRAVPMADSEPPELADPAADPAIVVSQDERLLALLRGLPVEQRAAILLVDAYDLTFRRAAEILAVPVSTLASRVSAARLSLRQALPLTPDLSPAPQEVRP